MTDASPHGSEVNALYAPPTAALTTTLGAPPFFVVSVRKLCVLSVFSFGAYSLFWWYKHWQAQRDVERVVCNPVLRAVFSVFFAHAMFKTLHARALARNDRPAASAGALTVIYIGTLLAAYPIGLLQGIWYLPAIVVVLGLQCVPLAIAQRIANEVVGDANGQSNSRITPLNMLWIVFGLLYGALTLVGTFALPPA